MVFQPGQSGNPAGRKPGTKNALTRPEAHLPIISEREIRHHAQRYGHDGIALLAQQMLDTKMDGKSRRAAAIALLDRAYGRPAMLITQRVIRTWDDLTDEELAALEGRPVLEVAAEVAAGEAEAPAGDASAAED